MKPVIAIFIPQLVAGGVQRCLLLLAEGFLDQGMQVDLVAGQAKGPFLKMVPPGINLIDLHSTHIRSALPGLVRYLRNSNPTALLSAQTHANIIATWAKKISGYKSPLVISEHNNMGAVVDAAGSGNMDHYRPILAHLFYPWANKVVAVSHGVARNLSKLTSIPLAKIHVIYNPLIPRNLDTLVKGACTHPWLASREIPVILAVGRLEKQKDFPTLIRAVGILNQQKLMRLVIYGEGTERPLLDDLIIELGLQSAVALPGFTDNVYACMKRASAFVLSSAWEGFPSVLVEAMACGIPVISTDCPSGPDELLEGGRLGRMVPVGNPVSMADAIQAALADTSTLEPARSKAREFSVERSAKQYLSLLLESTG